MPSTGSPLLLTTHDLQDVEHLRQRLAFSAEQTSAAQLIATVVARVAVRDLFVVEPSIEDVVRTLYTS